MSLGWAAAQKESMVNALLNFALVGWRRNLATYDICQEDLFLPRFPFTLVSPNPAALIFMVVIILLFAFRAA